MRAGHALRARAALSLLAAAAPVLLALGAEGGLRVYERWRGGQWPMTRAASVHADAAARARLFRYHPYLFAAGREGARSTVNGRLASFNSLGYRSPERAKRKPAGVRRVVCAGGSTTFDLLADGDDQSWPAKLERKLRAGGLPVEVWNAGFPGWTSLENVVSLATRDVDLEPDVVVLFQGINDLQPGGDEPFEPDYEGVHIRLMRQGLGLEMTPPPWYQRSLVLERLAAAAFGPRSLLGAPPIEAPLRAKPAIDAASVATFARNVRSMLAITRAHGAALLLVTQPIHIRAGAAEHDRSVLRWWLPGVQPEAAASQIERLNDVLRTIAREDGVALADAAREVSWDDLDFGDPLHQSAFGGDKLATFLRGHVERLLTAVPAAP